MSNHHDDEPLFSLELSDRRCPIGDIQQTTTDIDLSTFIDNDDDNRFVDNDTGVDPSQPG